MGKRIDAQIKRAAVEMYRGGISPTKIGETLGIARWTVNKLAKEEGLPLQNPQKSHPKATRIETAVQPIKKPNAEMKLSAAKKERVEAILLELIDLLLEE